MQNKMVSKRLSNWAGNVAIIAPYFAQPSTEEALIHLVRNHRKIRVVGSAHSWNNHFETQELLLSLDNYNKVLNLDRAAKTITVQSGIKLWQLNNFLDKYGLALINLGSINKQSVAGAISTGTHGTGIAFQCLASQVLQFSLILPDGTKRIFEKGTDLFNACVVSLGALGIISEVTLQVTDAFNLKEQTQTYSFDEVIEQLDSLLETNDHFKIWWLPPSKNVVVFTYQRTAESVNDSRFRQFFQDKIISVVGYRALVLVGNLFPNLRPKINQFLTAQFDKPLNRIEKSYKVFNVPEPPKHRETEWAFDLNNAKAILADYQKLFTQTKHTFNFIQEIRFTKADEFWLSECYGRNTVWIGAYNHFDAQWANILKDFEAFAQTHNARPHWGKEFSVNKQYLEKQYVKFDDFKRLKNHFDPFQKFSNHLIEQIFED